MISLQYLWVMIIVNKLIIKDINGGSWNTPHFNDQSTVFMSDDWSSWIPRLQALKYAYWSSWIPRLQVLKYAYWSFWISRLSSAYWSFWILHLQVLKKKWLIKIVIFQVSHIDSMVIYKYSAYMYIHCTCTCICMYTHVQYNTCNTCTCTYRYMYMYM